MTRRHDSLLPLTHDHHHALRNARMLRQATAGDRAMRANAVETFVQFFSTEAVDHFREEEEVIFPLVILHQGAPTTGIERVLSEHVVMHALVRELEAQAAQGEVSAETMLRLAELLRAHVRFEEDELFPAVEELAADSLSGVSLARRSRAP